MIPTQQSIPQQNFGSIQKLIPTRHGDFAFDVEPQEELPMLKKFLGGKKGEFSLEKHPSCDHIIFNDGTDKYRIRDDSDKSPIKEAFSNLKNKFFGENS